MPRNATMSLRSGVRLVDELFDLGLGDEVLGYMGKKATRVLAFVGKRYHQLAKEAGAFSPVVWDCCVIYEWLRTGSIAPAPSLDFGDRGVVFHEPAETVRGWHMMYRARTSASVRPRGAHDQCVPVILSEGDTVSLWGSTQISWGSSGSPQIALVLRNEGVWGSVRYDSFYGDMLPEDVFTLYYRWGPRLDARKSIYPSMDIEPIGVYVPSDFVSFRGWSNTTLGLGSGAPLSAVYDRLHTVPSTEFKLEHDSDVDTYIMFVPVDPELPKECSTYFVTMSQAHPSVPLFIFLAEEYYSYYD